MYGFIKRHSCFALTFLALTLSSCAYGPQFLSLNPEIIASGDSNYDLTNQTAFVLKVKDSRKSEVLGVSGDNSAQFDITLKENAADTLRANIAPALEERGLEVNLNQKENEPTLLIDLQKLTLNSIKKEGFGYVTNLDLEIVASVVFVNKKYSKRYIVGTEKKNGSVSSSKSSEILVNEAMTEALSSIVNDNALFKALDTQ